MDDGGAPLDWRTISRDWQAQEPPPALRELQPRLAADTRRLALATSADLVAFVVAAVLIVTFTMQRPTAGVMAAAGIVLAVNAWITAFSIGNRRGSWRAATATAEGYVTLLRARGRAALRAARVARGAAIVQALVVVGYVAVSVNGRPAPARPVVVAALFATAMVAGYLLFAQRQAANARAVLEECDELETLLRDEELATEGEGSGSL